MLKKSVKPVSHNVTCAAKTSLTLMLRDVEEGTGVAESTAKVSAVLLILIKKKLY